MWSLSCSCVTLGLMEAASEQKLSIAHASALPFRPTKKDLIYTLLYPLSPVFPSSQHACVQSSCCRCWPRQKAEQAAGTHVLSDGTRCVCGIQALITCSVFNVNAVLPPNLGSRNTRGRSWWDSRVSAPSLPRTWPVGLWEVPLQMSDFEQSFLLTVLRIGC